VKKTNKKIDLDLLSTQFTVDLLDANADERLITQSGRRLRGLTGSQQIETLCLAVGLLLNVIETLKLGDSVAQKTVAALKDQLATELTAEQIWRA
jgi:hypothetical protein